MLQVKVQLLCPKHGKRDPACPACRHLAYIEKRYDSLYSQRSRLIDEIRSALIKKELVIIDLR